MIGTIVNTACIIVGSLGGAILKRGVNPKLQMRLFNALGVCTLLLGANAFVHNLPNSTASVLFIVSLALGTAIGYALHLDERFDRLVNHFRKSDISSNGPNLSEGLSTGILLYCIGTFSMVGPVLSALQGDNTYLYTNATLDLITSAVLASTFGIGMIWAAPVLFCWQGTFYMIAKFSETIISQELICEISIVGGVLIAAAGLDLLKLKEMKVLNMIPALLIPPLFFLIRSVF